MIHFFYIILFFTTYVNCVKDGIFNWLQDDDNIVSSKILAIMERTQKEQHEEARRRTSDLASIANIPSYVSRRSQLPQVKTSTKQKAINQMVSCTLSHKYRKILT